MACPRAPGACYSSAMRKTSTATSPAAPRTRDTASLRPVTGGADWLGFTFEVQSPRDVATGQSSGKRQHGTF